MKLSYTQPAKENLDKLSPDIKERIVHKMQFFASAPDPMKFAKRLTHDPEGDFAFRVGDWRIKCVVTQNTIFVFRIEHRSRAYF